MTAAPRPSTVTSADGTTIAFLTVGQGDPVILVGGRMRTAEDYLPLARSLTPRFSVHLIDRRGRGSSGPQGPDHSIARECDDVLALQASTGAVRVFGHSYGGLVALRTAARAPVFDRIAVYEPGVSVGGSIPTAWMPRYRELLGVGDPRGAFAHFVRGSGHAPGPVARLPLWYLRTVLRLVVRAPQWRRMEPLLASNLAEHEEVRRLDGDLTAFAAVAAQVLLLGGSRSPQPATVDTLQHLRAVLPSASIELLDGLDHNAPDEHAPDVVGTRVRRFLETTPSG
ncbi:alpha/beta fold hydrolase [Geodermatophilus maliterrae]|uniref:Alpha/beta fold hydrolase n=1 Tax=Geodermatophilus maliterrae TaxID=3162531 RepID=A0ABV3XCI7_9ACTN